MSLAIWYDCCVVALSVVAARQSACALPINDFDQQRVSTRSRDATKLRIPKVTSVLGFISSDQCYRLDCNDLV